MAHHLDLNATLLALFPDILRETFGILAVEPMLWSLGVAFVAVPSFKKIITITKLNKVCIEAQFRHPVNHVAHVFPATCPFDTYRTMVI